MILVQNVDRGKKWVKVWEVAGEWDDDDLDLLHHFEFIKEFEAKVRAC